MVENSEAGTTLLVRDSAGNEQMLKEWEREAPGMIIANASGEADRYGGGDLWLMSDEIAYALDLVHGGLESEESRGSLFFSGKFSDKANVALLRDMVEVLVRAVAIAEEADAAGNGAEVILRMPN